MEKTENQKKPKNNLLMFASYYKPHKRLFFFDMLSSLMIALIDLSFPLITRHAINSYLPDKNYTMFFLFMGIVLITFLLRILFQYFVQYHGHALGVNLEGDMRKEIFSHLQKMSFSFYDKNRTGNLMSRILNDLFEITELAHHGPEDLFISSITLVGSLIIILSVNATLALALFALVPVIVIFTIARRRSISKVSAKYKEKTGVINTAIESSISGVRVTKAFANEDYELEKFNSGNNQYMKSRKAFFKQIGIFGAGVDFLTNLMNLVVIAVGGLLIMKSKLDFADLTIFVLYIGVFLQPIRRLSMFVEQFTVGMAGFKRFRAIMNTEPEIVDDVNAVDISDVKGDISFKNVTFSYNDDIDVLSGVNLNVKAGTTVALVGPSGGGKSTLCHLVPRFYETTDGEITLDGKDVKKITLSSLRKNVGIVQQDVLMFADTIRENIRYGNMDATDEEVTLAAKRAEIHEDIMGFSEGYDTLVGERGVTLSGGQKQRISIARIFLKNPPVLILDEATSALDSVTEIQIQRSLENLSEGRTTLVIAHRLSTVRDADEIVYIDPQGVREQGSHKQLIEQKGLYAKLYETQYNNNY